MFTNPFSQSQQMLDAWSKMTQDQIALMKETLAYATELSTEWRKITLDATKRAADAVTPKA